MKNSRVVLRVLSLVAMAFAGGPLAQGRPLRLLFDDYYQIPRPGDFPQGVALVGEQRKLSNFYHPDATAIPNGTFVFSRVIAGDYDVRVSQTPISAELLGSTDAYLMVCPVPPSKGGRAPLTEKEAAQLESFVANGGIFILALNSVANPATEQFDFSGANLLLRPFGLRFAEKTTQTLLIPIPRDHPLFSGVRNVIYGNGTIIEPVPGAATSADTTTLIESCNPAIPGAVAVRVRYKKGTVLALGDAGMLGNAHLLRDETDQAEVLRQMMHSLLPDGPLPAYGWRDGLRLRVKLFHQQIISGYPDELRLFDLPRDPASKYVEVGMRSLDRQAASQETPPPPGTKERGFASAVAEGSVEVNLVFGRSDGRAFAATWQDGHGSSLRCRVTPRGDTLDLALGAPDLALWRWAFAGAAIFGSLDPAARADDVWTRKIMVPLPQAQLAPAPRLREATATCRFEGTEERDGRTCFVLSQTAMLSQAQIPPQDLIDPAYADYFNQRNIHLSSGSQLVYLKTWIDQRSRLPVRTELKASAAFWWSDEDQPDLFISTHDAKRVYEGVKATRHVVTFGRVLTADFAAE